MTRLGKVDYRALTRDERAHQYGAVNRVAPHGGDSVAAALQAQKVAVVFTLCGGHISPILTGAKARGIRVVDVRSEATAVFAADAVSRLTGAPGVAAVTAGPGVTNAVTALKNAQLAQSAVVLLAGAAPTLLHGRGALQDIDQRAVVAPHVKLASKIKRARDIGQAIASAFTIAREGVQGPAFVECAADLLYGEATVRAWYLDASGKDHSLADRLQRFYVNRHLAKLFAGTGTAAATPSSPIATPAPRGWSIAAAVECIGRASRPLVVIGSQALAGEDPHRVAAAVMRLGIPTYLSGMARGLLGRDHPLQLRHRRREALREADCVILAGVSCDFRLDYGRQLRSTLIAANRSRKDATLNRRPDIVAIGDAGLFLEQLSDHTSDPTASWQGWLNELRARDEARNAEIARQGVAHGELVNPIALLQAVDKVASDNAIFVADGGDFVATASYIVRPRKPRSWLDPGPFGTLGAGAGFALGAALCSPDSEIWILFGDGACGYSIIEFDTFVRHRIPIIAVIGNDAGWTQIAREQAKWLKDDVGTVLARSSYHDVAAAFGAEGILVKTTAEVPAALERARSVAKAGQPALVNAWLDRSEFREGSISM